jgi:hypothetical protein
MEFSTSSLRCALVALALIAGVAGHPSQASAAADASQCTIFPKSDAEKFFKAPVVYVESPNKTDCSWGLASNSSVGVIVSREPRSDWYPPKPGSTSTSQVHHVTGVGENAYTYYANAGYGGVYTAEVLNAKGVTSVSLAEKAGNAADALKIARIAMNR